jgi:plastocyanin
MKRFPLLVLVCVLAAFGLAACGGDDNKDTTSAPAATETSTTETTTTGEAGGGKTVKVAADPSGALAFEQKTLSAPAGQVTFEFTNQSSTPHDFALERDGEEIAKTDVITEDTTTATATLEAGEYTFFCSVPGHRQAGMEGTLTAK